MKTNILKSSALFLLGLAGLAACGPKDAEVKEASLLGGDVASKVYVAPGEHDEYYAFMSGGFSGQVSVYGLPSGRLFRVIPVFSQDPEKGYGYNEETKDMLKTSYGYVPWDDAHHPEFSQTDGQPDGKWLFINGNNTPRIARIDLTTFETAEIIEIPNTSGNHCSPFTTENSEYIVAGTRFSIPLPNEDVSLGDVKEEFTGTLSFIGVDKESGQMDIRFQILVPGYDYDLAHAGKGKSHGWVFFTSYNTEQAGTLKEINSSKNDKDFIVAVNWKKAEEYLKQGKGKELAAKYLHNIYNEEKQMAESFERNGVIALDPTELPGLMYYLPTPKSPHGVDVDPTGEYIVGNGKLSADLTVHSFSKMLKAIENKEFEGEIGGVPVLKFESVLDGVVKQPGLGPLHTEFDGKGNAYSSFFISSEIVKWNVETKEILDRTPTFYSIGHLMIPGGDSKRPWGKYMVALNKITKDRYLPTGPELTQSAQLYDISGDKIELLLDFPTIGEPHYAQAMPAEILKPKSKKTFSLEHNQHPHVTKMEKDARMERKGNEVHVYMTSIRSHFAPDNLEGIKVGDKVYFHVTNVEQDWDLPHGFAVLGMNTAELLIMPGQTRTLVWEPKKPGVYPFYCTDFCSALHQEMQGYARVSPKGSNPEMKWGTGNVAL
ncbi:Sec-dependent nitrous-oxide reductase [Nafulsella turpanensis]|uniref:Sec-dependent nitrous-oxide reductase n=1 Tax=Nafulsella turpanensis TaxID=1265690 RepID=UPI000347454D|nr:Sec-dependent nitrous-oxide reductase [Nafulsella turpanensis]